MSSVLSFGEALIDIIADDGATSLEEAGHFAARPGGAPANVAVALSRLGIPAAFCGCVGDDPFGNRLRKVLEADGVDTANLSAIPGANTTLAFAWKNDLGDGNFRILRMADLMLTSAMVDVADVAGRLAIVVGSVNLTADPSRTAIGHAVSLAQDANVPVVVDINIRPTMWPSREAARTSCLPILERATLLKLSVDDAEFLFDQREPDAIFAAPSTHDSILLLTDGARGAWFRNASGQIEHVPAFAIDPVEPTGAGDAFTAAIISRYLVSHSAPNRADVAFAAAAGAITATRIGAIASLPYLSEIEEFLRRA